MSRIFVNRESELQILTSLLKARLNGANYFVLIYGIRRIGKSRLVDEFLKDKIGFRADCSSIVTGGDLFKIIYSNLRSLKANFRFSDVLKKYEGMYIRPLEDDFEMIKICFDMINECAEKVDYLIVALDEFHSFIENISSLRLRGGELGKERLLWLLRDRIQRLRYNVFLIILTSAGFLFEEYSKADKAFLQLFQRIEIKPLNEESSIKLAEKLLNAMSIKYTYEALQTIAKFSGGVPKLIEEIVGYLSIKKEITTTDVIELVEQSLRSGYFDDFFDAYLSFLSETTKWSKATLVKILRAIAEGIKSPKEMSRKIGIKYNTLLNILSDIRKKGIISKDFEISYPLLKEWLLSRDLPPSGAKRIDLLRQSLGVAIEYYVRELFKSINKRITIAGEHLFLGTAEKLELGPIKSVEGGGELDFIAHQADGKKIIGEIKLGKISRQEVIRFSERAEKIEGKKMLLIIASDAEPHAIAEIVRRGIIFMHIEGLNDIAKKVGFPKLHFKLLA